MAKLNPSNENEQLQHLELARALVREGMTAISAIEKNDLSQLQSAIARQETLCSQLAAMPWNPCMAERTTLRQIHEAYAELAQVNRVYDGVVKRSKRCADMLLSLYGRFNLPALTDRTAWACEV